MLYRILHAAHPRTGDAWCIYPTYDFAHGQSDAIEGVTHSLCTLEFEDHRPLYDWLIEHLPVPSRPRQYEFARLNLSHTILSKRRLIQLVEEGHVRGWDDPRMPTLAGLRRRGVPPAAIREFARRIGVAKTDNLVDDGPARALRARGPERSALRRMAVLRPLKVVIENYPEGQVEEFEAINNPEDPAAGTRRCRSRASCSSSATTSWRSRPQVLPPRARARGAPALRLPHHLPGGGEGRRRQRGAAALHVRSGDPRRRCAGRTQGQGDPALGVGATPCPPRCGCTTTCSRARSPGPTAISWPTSIRARSRS